MVSTPEKALPPASPRRGRRGPRLRRPIGIWWSLLCAALSIIVVFIVWWMLTAGEGEQRILSYAKLPSPKETFAKFPSLWVDGALTRNTLVTLRRVTLGFGLALAVGIPLGVLAGCYAPIRAYLAPLVIFGRNIPVAALIPLTFFFFGIDEKQKVVFIFMSSVAFIIADVTDSISDVGARYLDTAYTLGANAWQTIIKVLVPLAMPSILNSARVLFGLAFGYIMLAEVIRSADEAGGLGSLINIAQRQGPREYIYLIILVIPIVAFAIDRFLFLLQRELFPHRYGGSGTLNRLMRALSHWWGDLKGLAWKPRPPFDQLTLQLDSTEQTVASPGDEQSPSDLKEP